MIWTSYTQHSQLINLKEKFYIPHLTSYHLWCYTISQFPFNMDKKQKERDKFARNAVNMFIVFGLVAFCLFTVLIILFHLINCLGQIDFDAGFGLYTFLCSSIYLFIFHFDFFYFSFQFLFQVWWFNLHEVFTNCHLSVQM